MEYFQSLGIDTRGKIGAFSEEDNDTRIYYGVINALFDNYCLERVQAVNAKIIELPKNFGPKRGDKVLVWDDNEEEIFAVERIFLTEIAGAKYPFIVVQEDSENDFKNGKPFNTWVSDNMKPIPEPQIVELTLEDISNGKGVGLNQN